MEGDAVALARALLRSLAAEAEAQGTGDARACPSGKATLDQPQSEALHHAVLQEVFRSTLGWADAPPPPAVASAYWDLACQLIAVERMRCTAEEIAALAQYAATLLGAYRCRVMTLAIIGQAELLVSHQPLDPAAVKALEQLRNTVVQFTPARTTAGYAARLDALLGATPVFDTRDVWAASMAAELDSMAPEESRLWRSALRRRRPTEIRRLLNVDAADRRQAATARLTRWLSAVHPPPIRRSQALPAAMAHGNARTLRSLLLACKTSDTAIPTDAVARVTTACLKKLPDVGPYSELVGNAGLVVLEARGDSAAVRALSRLHDRVTHMRTRRLIDVALRRIAARAGVEVDDLQEESIDTQGVNADGTLRIVDGTRAVVLTIGPAFRAETSVVVDGRRSTVRRRAVRDATLNDVLARERTINHQLVAHSRRLEALLWRDRVMPVNLWLRRYRHNPLLSALATGLVWELIGVGTAVMCSTGFVDSSDRAVDVGRAGGVRLWHPVESPSNEIAAWRQWATEHLWTQPFAQVHRAIFECDQLEPTATAVDVFAGHLVDEGALALLCRRLGWQYSLQIGDPAARPTRSCPGTNTRCELEVRDTNLWGGPRAQLLTGVVRFVVGARAVPLMELPRRLYSEALHEADRMLSGSMVSDDADEVLASVPPPDYWTSRSDRFFRSTVRRRLYAAHLALGAAGFGSSCGIEGSCLTVNTSRGIFRVHAGTAVVLDPDGLIDHTVAGRRNRDLPLPYLGDPLLRRVVQRAARLLLQEGQS